MYNLELRPFRRQFWNNELDKMFDHLATKTEDVFAPACEITEEEKHFSISLDIPGLQKDDISIEVKENQLYVTGERKFTGKSDKDNVLRTERRYGKFTRTFTLPANVNTEAIQARFENGVLDLALPKEEKAQSRKISISDWKDAGLKS